MWLLRVTQFFSKCLPLSVPFCVASVLVLALVVHQICLVGDFRVDDAYISFSFANNLAAGNGLVYSHGLRVEGYSNFLWVVVVALGRFFVGGPELYPAARVIAFLFLSVGVTTTYLLVRCFADRWAAFFAVALVLSNTDVIRAAISGLETVPYMVAIVFGWYVYFREPVDSRCYSLLAFLPAALLRIDGFIPMGVVIGFEIVSSLVERRFSLCALLRWAAPAVCVYLLYFAWRWDYYGLLFPSTYYAKEFVTREDPNRGFDQAFSFLRESAGLAVLPLMFLPVVCGPKRESWGLLAAVWVQVAYSTYVGGDWMPFNRFLLPIFPLAATLAAWGAQALVDSTHSAMWPARAFLGLGLCGVLGWVGVHGYAGSADTVAEKQKLAAVQHVQNHTRNDLLGVVDLARYVLRKPGEKFVTDYAGVFGVFTDAQVIDMWGLCNADIALRGNTEGILPIYGKACAQCYADIEPDYFHVVVPLVRPPDAFQNIRQVIDQVFQGRAIDRYLHLEKNYAVGRVRDTSSAQRAFWFLERRRSEAPLVPRQPAPTIRVDYPFERVPPAAYHR
jgi:hypothetical protein